MLILNETVAAGDDIAGRIDRLRHALSLWSRIMVVTKDPPQALFSARPGRPT
ncbi:hypothetical protein NKI19_19175 [Mesorhizobium sp. M0751]|uniref:hypothetical protein n=1 Tax=unclassified Mesorhizobium TaxID=325217 RepID=UPI00333DCE60